MSQVQQTSCVSLPCAAVAIHEGYIYKSAGATTYRMTPTTAVNDTAIAIADRTYIDVQLGTAGTKVAGDEAEFYLLGDRQIVNVAFASGLDVLPFDQIYISSTSGLATNAHSTSRPIGHNINKVEVVSTTAGQLLPVYLDVIIGADTVA